MNQAALDNKVDDLLARWHEFTSGYRAARGYASSDATCRMAQSGRLWDRDNGLADEASERSTMVQVARAVDRVPNVPQAWNTAIHMHARNLHTGHEVWFSPRLPKDREELRVLLLEARNMLVRHMMDLGLLS